MGKIRTCNRLERTTSIAGAEVRMRIALESSTGRSGLTRAYNPFVLDLLIRALSYVLVPMFLVGMAGSAVVVAITLAKDLHDFLSDDGSETSTPESLS